MHGDMIVSGSLRFIRRWNASRLLQQFWMSFLLVPSLNHVLHSGHIRRLASEKGKKIVRRCIKSTHLISAALLQEGKKCISIPMFSRGQNITATVCVKKGGEIYSCKQAAEFLPSVNRLNEQKKKSNAYTQQYCFDLHFTFLMDVHL